MEKFVKISAGVLYFLMVIGLFYPLKETLCPDNPPAQANRITFLTNNTVRVGGRDLADTRKK